MPTPGEILESLTAIANGARAGAVAWHAALAGLVVTLASGWRPSRRLLGTLATFPLFSAAAVAGLYGNPFNLAVLAAFGVALVWRALRLPGEPVRFPRGWPLAAGLAVLVYGWVYPHFLAGASPITYLYAAPTGLVPCPSLSVAVGLGLLAGGLGDRTWSWILAGAGLFYGLFGLLRLGVLLDVGLLCGAAALAAVGWRERSVRVSKMRRF